MLPACTIRLLRRSSPRNDGSSDNLPHSTPLLLNLIAWSLRSHGVGEAILLNILKVNKLIRRKSDEAMNMVGISVDKVNINILGPCI
jgi:hypothetical protein